VTESTPNPENRFGGVTISTGETFPVTLSCFGICAEYWAANEQYDVGDFVWPAKPLGFVLECTGPVGGGRSGATEPKSKGKVAGDTVSDGSVTWTLRVPDNVNGIRPITSVEATGPAGITISSPVISENTKVLVDYMSTAVDETFEVVLSITIGGRVRVCRQEVHVAEK
jgi:hypothetical protein